MDKYKYWKTRCELAESCLNESPCDTDITSEQIVAHRKYNDFLDSSFEPTENNLVFISCDKNKAIFKIEGDLIPIGKFHTNFKGANTFVYISQSELMSDGLYITNRVDISCVFPIGLSNLINLNFTQVI